MEIEQRGDMIADLVQRYQSGAGVEQVKREARAVFTHASTDEMLQVERYLASVRHIRPADFQEVYQLHLDDLQRELSQLRSSLEPWHPVRTMIEEHEAILATLDRLDELNGRVQESGSLDRQTLASLSDVADNLLAAEHHHAREEDVVFPELTKNNIGGIVQVMHMEHDELRGKKRQLRELVDDAGRLEYGEFRQRLDELAKYIVYNLADHIYKENHILYPAALRFVKDEHMWQELKKRCDQIGYCNFKQ